MNRWIKRQALWIFYAIFVAIAIALKGDEPLFYSDGPYAAGKVVAWLLYLGFLAFSIYCSSRENFYKSLSKFAKLHWGRQIGADLYLGLVVSLFLIYLNEGSLLVVALWLVPVILFANLATLLYFAMNYGAIVAHFVP